MTVRFIPEFTGIVPDQPGLPIEVVQRRFGLEQVVKLASERVPAAAVPEVKEAVIGALDRLQRHPDGFSTDLREAVAAQHDRSPEQITVGCGTCELLYLLAHADAERGDEVVLAAPSFTSYRDVIDIRGAVPVVVPLVDYTDDLEAMAAPSLSRTRMIFVCNRNNPTGNLRVRSADVRRLVESVRTTSCVAIDEAYIEFVTAEDREGSARDREGPRQRRRPAHLLQDLRPLRLRTGYGVCAPRGQAGGRQGPSAVQREPARRAARQSKRSSTPTGSRNAARPTPGSAT